MPVVLVVFCVMDKTDIDLQAEMGYNTMCKQGMLGLEDLELDC